MRGGKSVGVWKYGTSPTDVDPAAIDFTEGNGEAKFDFAASVEVADVTAVSTLFTEMPLDRRYPEYAAALAAAPDQFVRHDVETSGEVEWARRLEEARGPYLKLFSLRLPVEQYCGFNFEMNAWTFRSPVVYARDDDNDERPESLTMGSLHYYSEPGTTFVTGDLGAINYHKTDWRCKAASETADPDVVLNLGMWKGDAPDWAACMGRIDTIEMAVRVNNSRTDLPDVLVRLHGPSVEVLATRLCARGSGAPEWCSNWVGSAGIVGQTSETGFDIGYSVSKGLCPPLPASDGARPPVGSEAAPVDG